jgi:hypothetical protein
MKTTKRRRNAPNQARPHPTIRSVFNGARSASAARQSEGAGGTPCERSISEGHARVRHARIQHDGPAEIKCRLCALSLFWSTTAIVESGTWTKRFQSGFKAWAAAG